MKSFFKKTILVINLLATTPLLASDLPPALFQPDGLQLRIIPTNSDPIEGAHPIGVGPKSVVVHNDNFRIQVKWVSEIKVQNESSPWPEYRVLISRGVLQTHSIHQSSSMIHPHLWAPGFFNLEQNGLLWLPPEWLKEGSKKKSFVFDVGFISPTLDYFKKSPVEIFSQVNAFKNSFDQLKKGGGQEGLSAKEKKLIQDFTRGFDKIHVLSSNRSKDLVVNGQTIKVPTQVFGNKYVQYSVLDSQTNPLILAISFSTTNIPKVFQGYFRFFEKNMGYRISQINTY